MVCGAPLRTQRSVCCLPRPPIASVESGGGRWTSNMARSSLARGLDSVCRPHHLGSQFLTDYRSLCYGRRGLVFRHVKCRTGAVETHPILRGLGAAFAGLRTCFFDSFPLSPILLFAGARCVIAFHPW